MTPHNPTCFAHHMGLYAIDHGRARAIERMMAMCPSEFLAASEPGKMRAEMLALEPGNSSNGLYALTANGIAVIPIVGVITKGSNKFGTSTNDTRRALRAAVDDPQVKAIMLHLDTPGGSTAGVDDLAADVAAAAAVKPLHAHADDLVASAGMWIASQASRLTINASGEAGSIGTYAVIEDTSGAAEMAGVQVHLVATGAFKGMGADGVPITEPQLARLGEMVSKVQEFFSAAMMSGRGMSKAQVNELVADGGVYFAKDAKAKGLVDGIESYQSAMDRLASKIRPAKREAAARRAEMLKYSIE